MTIICTSHHLVDDGDDGRERFATPGLKGRAKRQHGIRRDDPNAWRVQWRGGAWGFYSDPELRELTMRSGA